MKPDVDAKREAVSYHHGGLRKALIEAALELAAEGESWNFSLREVARRAGVSHNAPYNHFAHKRDLLEAAAAAGHDLLLAEMTAVVDWNTDAYEMLLRMGLAYFKFGTKNPALYRLMFNAAQSGPDWHPEKVLAAGMATRSLLEDAIYHGASRGILSHRLTGKTEREIAALNGWASVHGLTMLAIDGLAAIEGVPEEQVVNQALITLMQGLRPDLPDP